VAVEGQSGRHGITAMRERAEAVGGRLFVHSKPGLGTEIAMVLP
jgi:signal transduction histidine kinase